MTSQFILNNAQYRLLTILALALILPITTLNAETKIESGSKSGLENHIDTTTSNKHVPDTIPQNTSSNILSNCPKSPNCVSSQISKDQKHYISPIYLNNGSIQDNRHSLIKVLNQLKRVSVVINNKSYIKVEFSSKLFNFIDDTEFVIFNKHIDVRSASRKGYYDFKANRNRIETIRSLLDQASNQ